MPALRMTLISGLMLTLGWTTSVRGQDVVIVLKNGSRFQGLVAAESEQSVEIDLGNGRIRITKADIVSREDLTPEKPDAVATDAPSAASSREGEALRRYLRQRDAAPASAPSDVAIGGRVAARAVDPTEFPIPDGTPEAACQQFLDLLLEGRVEEAISHWVDPARALRTYFPFQEKGLTRYSKEEATRLFLRFLILVASDADLIGRLKCRHPEILTVREAHGSSLVELKIAGDGREEVLATLLCLDANRIVDFGVLLPGLRSTCGRISDGIRENGLSAATLVPALELAIAQRLTKDVDLGVDAGDAPVTTGGTPLVRRVAGYRLAIPPGWNIAPNADKPLFADILLKDGRGQAFAMVIQEDQSPKLQDLERSARGNLQNASRRVDVLTRQLVQVGEHRGLRFDAVASIDRVSLVYRYLLVTTATRSYQVIAWGAQGEDAALAGVMNDLLDSFRALGARVVALPEEAPPSDLPTNAEPARPPL